MTRRELIEAPIAAAVAGLIPLRPASNRGFHVLPDGGVCDCSYCLQLEAEATAELTQP